eukprot:6488947-Amphidinium_carterae.1
MGKLSDLLRDMICSKQWRGVFLVEHSLYDETPLQVNLRWHGDEAATETGKIFMFEQSVTMLVERLPSQLSSQEGSDFHVLQFALPSSVRAAANATGDTIYKMLETLPQYPSLRPHFDTFLTLVETDENPANGRAEAMRAKKVGGLHSLLYCLAHKTHSIATKTWQLESTVLSGLLHTAKVLQQAGALTRLRDALSVVATKKFKVEYSDALSYEAKSFRQQLLTYFQPPPKQTRRNATVLAALSFFGSDLRRQDGLIHVCRGVECCANEAESLHKGIWLLKRLFTALRPKMFSRANWLDWGTALNFYAFAIGLHGVGITAFHLAYHASGKDGADLQGPLSDMSLDIFAGTKTAGEDAALGEQDTTVQKRAENATSLRIAKAFMCDSLHEDIWLFRLTLEPQRRLMDWMLHSLSSEWEVQQLHAQMTQGHRQYRVNLLREGDVLPTFFESSCEILSAGSWSFFAETEQFRSKLFKLVARSAAVRCCPTVESRRGLGCTHLHDRPHDKEVVEAVQLCATVVLARIPSCVGLVGAEAPA